MIDKNARSLFVVGDEKQCIYAFRGSRVDLILQFNKFYPTVKEIILNQNYRSTQPILDMAEKVISHNANQKKVGLFTDNPRHDKKVKYYLARNERDEADFIIKSLYELYQKDETTQKQSVETQQSNFYANQTASDNDYETVFVADDEYSLNQNSKGNSISSMFDIYLNADDLSEVSKGTNLWSSYGLGDSYNPTSWKLKEADWKNCEDLNNVAILYRTHAQSRSIEEALLKYKVPYKLVSGTRFLDRKEVKDVMAVLRFVSNGNDKLALSRFLPLILPGVGAKTMEKIYNFLQDPEYPLAPRYAEMIQTILLQIAQIHSKHTSLIEFTKELLIEIGYNEYLKNEYPAKDELITRQENIAEIYSLMLQFDGAKELDLSAKLSQFLNQVMLLSNLEAKDDQGVNLNNISLMTLHQSKGLEFDTVFLVGCEDGILPHQNSLSEVNGFEEEVRLAYVGVTRAKKNLYLLSADSRVQFGQVKTNPVSRIFRPFLDSHAKRIN